MAPLEKGPVQVARRLGKQHDENIYLGRIFLRLQLPREWAPKIQHNSLLPRGYKRRNMWNCKEGLQNIVEAGTNKIKIGSGNIFSSQRDQPGIPAHSPISYHPHHPILVHSPTFPSSLLFLLINTLLPFLRLAGYRDTV